MLALGTSLADVDVSKVRPSTIAAGSQKRPDLNYKFRAPSSATEKALAEIWTKILGVSPIGIDDDFFDLGGDSIEAIQIQHTINRDFELNIKSTEFLQSPTIASLALHIGC